jgi:hypothetical protein
LHQAELDCEAALVKKWHDAAPDDWRAARDLLARRFPDRWGREVEERPPDMGLGLHITLLLGPADDPILDERLADRTIELEDHQRREREIKHTEMLATAPIKDKL